MGIIGAKRRKFFWNFGQSLKRGWPVSPRIAYYLFNFWLRDHPLDDVWVYVIYKCRDHPKDDVWVYAIYNCRDRSIALLPWLTRLPCGHYASFSNRLGQTTCRHGRGLSNNCCSFSFSMHLSACRKVSCVCFLFPRLAMMNWFVCVCF